jgi:hypothetical protein
VVYQFSKNKVEEVFEQIPGFEDLGDFPGFGSDLLEDGNSSWWSVVISRPPFGLGTVIKS